MGAYVAKYFSKAAHDVRFDGFRKFYASLNVKQPEVVYGDHVETLVNLFTDKGMKTAFTNQYFSEWCGEIKYSSYNLYQSPARKGDQ